MKTSRWKVVLLLLGVVVAAGVLGTTIGSLYGEQRAGAERAARDAEVREYLLKSIRQIEVGKAFPEVTLGSPDSAHQYLIHELLPRGGVLVFVSAGCESCFQAVDALSAARRRVGRGAPDVIVVVIGDPSGLSQYIADHGYGIPVFRDWQQALVKEYGVRAFPCYFVLDNDLHLTHIGTNMSSPGVLASAFGK